MESRLKALNQVKIQREERHNEMLREIEDLKQQMKPPNPKIKQDEETEPNHCVESEESIRRLRRAEDVFNETLRQEAAKLNMTVEELKKMASGANRNELPFPSNRRKTQLC